MNSRRPNHLYPHPLSWARFRLRAPSVFGGQGWCAHTNTWRPIMPAPRRGDALSTLLRTLHRVPNPALLRRQIVDETQPPEWRPDSRPHRWIVGTRAYSVSYKGSAPSQLFDPWDLRGSQRSSFRRRVCFTFERRSDLHYMAWVAYGCVARRLAISHWSISAERVATMNWTP